MSEIRNSLRVQKSRNYTASVINNCNNIAQDSSGPSNTLNMSFTNVASDASEFRYDRNVKDDAALSLSSVSEISEDFPLSEDISNKVPFNERLASCFTDNNLTHVQCNNILALLRTHSCFFNLSTQRMPEHFLIHHDNVLQYLKWNQGNISILI